MDYKQLFYWLVVADNAKTFFGTFAIFFSVVFIIAQLARIIEGMNDNEQSYLDRCNKWTWYSTPFMLLFLSLWIFTPSKRDSLLIIAGGETINFLTNDKSAKQIPHELSNFIVLELKNMAKDAEVDLNIKDQKDRLLEEAKEMSSEQLIEELKTNEELKKILLQ